MSQIFQSGAHFLVRINPEYEREMLTLGKTIWTRPTSMSVVLSAYRDARCRLMYLPNDGNTRLSEHADTLERSDTWVNIGGNEYELQEIRWFHVISWFWQAIVCGTIWPWRWTWTQLIKNIA